jgi:hypothetical protein
VAAARTGALGAALQRGRERLTALDGGRGAVPRAAVLLPWAAERARERLVRLPPRRRGRRLVDRRTHEWVAKLGAPGVHAQQTGLLGGRKIVGAEAEGGARAQHRGDVIVEVRGDDQQQPPSALR